VVWSKPARLFAQAGVGAASKSSKDVQQVPKRSASRCRRIILRRINAHKRTPHSFSRPIRPDLSPSEEAFSKLQALLLRVPVATPPTVAISLRLYPHEHRCKHPTLCRRCKTFLSPSPDFLTVLTHKEEYTLTESAVLAGRLNNEQDIRCSIWLRPV
jgi:hypothetical protein